MKDRAQRLMAEGFDAVGESDTRRARQIVKELKKLRHSSAFEILAQAYLAEDRLQDAVKTLEEGVRLAPTVWRLWQLLGNCHSDLERYQESDTCHRRALECPSTDPGSIHLNMAIAHSKKQRLAEAVQELQIELANQPENKHARAFLQQLSAQLAEQLAKAARQ